MATVIGLCIRVKLMRSLPSRCKVQVLASLLVTNVECSAQNKFWGRQLSCAAPGFYIQTLDPSDLPQLVVVLGSSRLEGLN